MSEEDFRSAAERKSGKRMGRPPSLATEAGLTRKEAMEFQLMAALPDEQYQALLVEMRAEGKRICRGPILRAARDYLGRDQPDERVSVPLDPVRAAAVLNARLDPDQRFELARLLVAGIEDLAEDYGWLWLAEQ